MAYKTGSRIQMTFLPPVIENYVSKQDPVRVYDAFVDALDFKALGIPIEPYKAGALQYYPKQILKLLIYGYSYGIKSSRKLERACYHNLSFIWLMEALKPDYRTIARFRATHREAIKEVLKQCVHMCLELDLIEGNALFIDGSSFRANASIKNTWTKERCQKHIKKLSEDIDKLVDESVHIDNLQEKQNSLVTIKKELTNKIKLKNKVQQIASNLKQTHKKSINTIDPDCVKVRSRQGTHAGYNTQLTVDEKHGFIVTAEAAEHSQDANQFNAQIKEAQKTLNKKPKITCADSGYHSLEDLEQVDNDITVIVPSQKQTQVENNHPLSAFDKDNFKYDPIKDEYICPQGKRLKYMSSCFTRLKPLCWMLKNKKDKTSKRRYYRANSKDCKICPDFGTCTKSSQGRLITRFVQEELKHKLEAAYKSKQGQEIYKLRKEKVELPFGHIKHNLKAGQFLLRSKPGVNSELAVLATCFNIARMITLVGIPELILKLNSS